ncbi:Transcription elongation factor [Pseudozyma hubeiensis]|nr:Transcription elongation factor [Pseudozyma hubeiensis]
MSDIRSKSANFLADSISAATGGQDASSSATQLEQAVFEKFGQSTSNDYRNDVRNIGLTLKKDNPQLAQDLLQGNVAPGQLVNMSHEEMKTDEQAKQDQQLRQQNLEASVGVDELDPEHGSTQGISRTQEDDMETYGEAGDSSMGGGGEGEFKARAQPKVGEAMRGIEFETGI